jgi:hypothetical protein
MYRCVAKTSGAKAFLVHCIFLRNAQQNTAVAEDPTEPSFQKVYPKLPEVKVDKNFELPLFKYLSREVFQNFGAQPGPDFPCWR